jgi:hypothetical protein
VGDQPVRATQFLLFVFLQELYVGIDVGFTPCPSVSTQGARTSRRQLSASGKNETARLRRPIASLRRSSTWSISCVCGGQAAGGNRSRSLRCSPRPRVLGGLLVTVAMRPRPPYGLGVGTGVRGHDREPMDNQAVKVGRLLGARPTGNRQALLTSPAAV